jgi:hypothetical protein
MSLPDPIQEEGAPSPKRRQKHPELTPLELLRVAALPEVKRITGLSADTLKKHYADKIVRVSPRRIGMRIRDVLAIGTPRNA